MAIRVLFVDDAKDFVDYASRRLAARGIEVLPAYGGQEALDVLALHAVDVIILDVLMPDMDGTRVLREIRKTMPAVPVIMLTGHGTEAGAQEGRQLGAVDYLFKPCEFDELLAAIQAASETAE